MAANTRLATAVQALCVMVHVGDRGMTAEIVARSLDTNPVLVRRLMKDLERARLVRIRPGKDGGVCLAKAPGDITLDAVGRAVDGACGVFALRPGGNPACPVNRDMPGLLGPIFAAADDAVSRILAQTTIADLAAQVAAPRPPMMRRSGSPNQVLAIVCVGIILANLDLFIVNVALPNIARDFGNSSLEDLSWILNAYAITYASLLIFFGRLAERYRRNVSFLAGVGLFTAASAACAMASGVETLVAFRVVQAAGAALMTPTSLGLLLASFPPERRAGAVRTWTAIGGLGAALGPLIGGALVVFSWRWIFVINVPIGLVAILLGLRVLPEVPGHDAPRPDPVAAALVTAGIGIVTFAVVKGNDWGWMSPRIWLCLILAAILLALFVRHCLRSTNPFVDPRLFHHRHFKGAVLVIAPYSAAFGGMLLSIALYEQAVWGWSALKTGLAIAPGPLLVPVTSLLVAGRLIRRFGAATVVSAGILCMAAGSSIWATTIGLQPNGMAVVAGIAATGIGVGLTLPTLMGIGMGSLPPSAFATGSGVINMIRQAGLAIGVALFVAVLGAPSTPLGRVEAFHRGWWMITLIAAVGLVPNALYIRRAVAGPALHD